MSDSNEEESSKDTTIITTPEDLPLSSSSFQKRVSIVAKKQHPPMKFKKAPGAPRRFKSAFIFFSTQKHKEIRNNMGKAGEKEKTTTVAKMVSEAWKSLPSDQRKYWDEMAQQDKKRYEMEKSVYNGPWKVPVEKVLKDPRAPKRPMSAFLSYSNSKRAALKRKHPHMTNADVSRTLAAMWRQAKPDLKQKYIDTEFKLRQDYKVAIAEWRAKAEEREIRSHHDRMHYEETLEVRRQQQQQLQLGQSSSGQVNIGIPQIQQSPLMSHLQLGGVQRALDYMTPIEQSHRLLARSLYDEIPRFNEDSLLFDNSRSGDANNQRVFNNSSGTNESSLPTLNTGLLQDDSSTYRYYGHSDRFPFMASSSTASLFNPHTAQQSERDLQMAPQDSERLALSSFRSSLNSTGVPIRDDSLPWNAAYFNHVRQQQHQQQQEQMDLQQAGRSLQNYYRYQPNNGVEDDQKQEDGHRNASERDF